MTEQRKSKMSSFVTAIELEYFSKINRKPGQPNAKETKNSNFNLVFKTLLQRVPKYNNYYFLISVRKNFD